MTCHETTFLVDLLRNNDRATAPASSMDEAGERPTVTPVSAADVWVGAYLVCEAERTAAVELLVSLTRHDLTRECARTAGESRASLRRSVDGIGFLGRLIAATAIEHGEPLVTRHSDFERRDGLHLVSD